MADVEKTGKYRRQIGVCRIVVVILCIIIVALVIALAVVASKLESKQEANVESCPSRDNNINLDPPDVLPPFHDLTSKEISSIREFLFNQQDLNLVHPKDMATNTSYIYTMEILIPNKEMTLNYLDKGGAAPAREARVFVFRGDKPDPYCEEFVVGPLPNPSYKKQEVIRPFIYRPLTTPELVAAISMLNNEVQTNVGTIIRESYGGSLINCGDTCVGFKMITPMSSVASGESTARKMWFWLLPDSEFYTSYPYDFLVLMDLTNPDDKKYRIDKIFYGGQKFETLEELKMAYDSGTVEKSRIPYPVKDVNLFSSMNRRGKLFPEEPLAPPREFEPDGKRYSINGRHIKYMNWDFDVRMSTVSGPQIFDIRYNNERILYELSLQDAAAYYSGISPAIRFAAYVDSLALIGTRVRSLVAGADCPVHSTFLSADHVIETDDKPMHVDRAFCVFEHNTGFPLRRHLKPVSHQPCGSRTATFFDKSQDFARTPQDCRANSQRRRRRELVFQHVHFLCDLRASFGIARLLYGCRTTTLRLSQVNRTILYLRLSCEDRTVNARTPCGSHEAALRLMKVCLKIAAERTNNVQIRTDALRLPCEK